MEGLYSFLFTSSVFIIMVAALRAVLHSRISMRLQYALWLLVAVKLLVVPVPHIESAISIQRLSEPWVHMLQQGLSGGADQKQQDGSRDTRSEDAAGHPAGSDSRTEKNNAAGGAKAGSQAGYNNTAEGTKAGSELKGGIGSASGIVQTKIMRFLRDVYRMDQTAVMRLFFIVAGAGSVILFLYFFIGNIKFARYLRKRRVRYLGDGGPLPVYLVEGLPSPCLYGRTVYITPKLSADERQLVHVLTHEYCHYRQKDYIWSLLRSICLIVYWWNPLVWLAAYLSRQDCELACDEAAVELLGKDERISYGKTLICLASAKTVPKDYLCISTTMTGGGRSMKKRIQKIAKNQKGVLSAGILAVFISIICLVSVSTAEPVESKQTDTDEGQNQNAAVLGDHSIQDASDSQNKQPSDAVQSAGENDAGQNAGTYDRVQNAGANDPAQDAGAYEAYSYEAVSADRADHTAATDDTTAVFDLDEAVSQAVLSYNKESYSGGECMAEGHEILEQEQDADGRMTVYAITMFGCYGFEDDCFVKVSGTGSIPAVIQFSLDEKQGYQIEDYQVPMDGGFYLESIHEMFPEHLWEKCLSNNGQSELEKQEYAYARQYLKKIGRKAPITDTTDHYLLTDAGVSVKVSNKMCNLEKYGLAGYPYWIGSREEIIDGVRYVFAMDVDHTAEEIIYTKSVYDTGEIVEQHRFDMNKGKKL